MELLEAINIRHSRRKYLATPISNDLVLQLNTRIKQYNEEAGLHIQLVVNNGVAFQGIKRSYGLFTNVHNYIALIGKKDKDFKEKSGYYGEKLVLEATQLGLGTCWVAGTFDKKACAVDLDDEEDISCVITIGNIAEDSSRKEKIIRGVMHRKEKSAKQLSEISGEAPAWFWSGMEAVTKAPSAINLQPVIFDFNRGVISAKVKNMSQHQLIDMGIAKLHFEIGVGGGTWKWGNGGSFEKQ